MTTNFSDLIARLDNISDDKSVWLNRLAGSELIAGIQYEMASFIATGAEYDSCKTEFLEHAEEEKRHFDILLQCMIERDYTIYSDIIKLITNAYPKYESMPDTTTAGLVQFHVQAEDNAIKAYREFYDIIKDSDVTLADKIKGILSDEIKHKTDLQKIGSAIDVSGLQDHRNMNEYFSRYDFGISETVYHTFDGKFAKKIFSNDCLYGNADNDIQERPVVCVTRNPAYLYAMMYYNSDDAWCIRLTLDGRKLSTKYKGVPDDRNPDIRQYEEDIFGNITDLHRYIKRIDIPYTKINNISENVKKLVVKYCKNYGIPCYMVKATPLKNGSSDGEYKYSDTELLFKSEQIDSKKVRRETYYADKVKKILKNLGIEYASITQNSIPNDIDKNAYNKIKFYLPMLKPSSVLIVLKNNHVYMVTHDYLLSRYTDKYADFILKCENSKRKSRQLDGDYIAKNLEIIQSKAYNSKKNT